MKEMGKVQEMENARKRPRTEAGEAQDESGHPGRNMRAKYVY